MSIIIYIDTVHTKFVCKESLHRACTVFMFSLELCQIMLYIFNLVRMLIIILILYCISAHLGQIYNCV